MPITYIALFLGVAALTFVVMTVATRPLLRPPTSALDAKAAEVLAYWDRAFKLADERPDLLLKPGFTEAIIENRPVI